MADLQFCVILTLLTGATCRGLVLAIKSAMVMVASGSGRCGASEESSWAQMSRGHQGGMFEQPGAPQLALEEDVAAQISRLSQAECRAARGLIAGCHC